MGVPERSRQWYDAQSSTFRAYLDAFVQGMNDYAGTHGDRIADSVKVVLPVEAADVLAHAQRAIHLTFVAGSAQPASKRWGSLGSPGKRGQPRCCLVF